MGEGIFNLIDNFFTEHELDWKRCSHVCTDRAASMTGRHRGLVARIRQVNPDIQDMHRIIHREASASKCMSPELDSVLTDSVKVINFIKSRTLNARLFHKLCAEMGSDHHQLLRLCTLAIKGESTTETIRTERADAWFPLRAWTFSGC